MFITLAWDWMVNCRSRCSQSMSIVRNSCESCCSPVRNVRWCLPTSFCGYLEYKPTCLKIHSKAEKTFFVAQVRTRFWSLQASRLGRNSVVKIIIWHTRKSLAPMNRYWPPHSTRIRAPTSSAITPRAQFDLAQLKTMLIKYSPHIVQTKNKNAK